MTGVEVQVLDRDETAALGLSGLTLRLTRTDGVDSAGPVEVEVDYADFATAYGANYGSRLSLIALTPCEEGTEEEADCLASHELDSVNDTQTQTLTATAPATSSGTLLTAAATTTTSTSGEATGDYTATSLSPSSTWNVGTQAGGFSWNYPMAAPNVAGGLKPEIGLSYSSQSVDGRISTTNNQTSWIGEGFDYHPGYIERRYATCQDDGTEIPDQCWSHHNATLNLGGQATDLVYDDGQWTPRNDDGSKVERLTGTTNGDNDGEYWKVTTADGTQYFFGLNRLPGHTTGDEETNSAWTVPVFGNDSGEPCYNATLDDAWCDQAWRWNLDYVVDAQGNALANYYEAETNNYGRNFSSDPVDYDRGGYLVRTDYGLREDAPHATAPARVTYTVSERCLSDENFDCAVADRSEDNAEHWPDTPLDQECGTDCAGQHSPTFWTTKRLDQITTQVHDGTDYTTVDTWKFEHKFPDPGDGTDPALWLDSITHTGHVGGTESYPAITFAGTPMPNRIDSTTDGLAPMNKWRITSIYTETGGQVNVNYATPDCTAGSTPEPHANTSTCFPVIRTHQAGAEEITDWFAKYTVQQLVEVDLVGGQPDQVTTYDYVGAPAWRYMDDDGFVDQDKRTWSQWRGYDRVIVRTGHPDEVQTETEHLFYQGMDGDHLPDGTRSAQVTDSTGTSVADDPVFNGQTRETIVRNGVGGDVVSKTITTPWKDQTATSSHTWDERGAHMVNTERIDTYTALADGSFRQTSTVNTFDAYGMITQVHDQGDVADPDDDRCTNTTYARNTSAHLLSLVAQTRTVAADCEATASVDDVITHTRTLYDGGAFGDTPTQGRPTQTQRVADYDGTTPVFQTVTATEFDDYGRAVSVTDAENNTTTTDYTAALAGGHDTKVETTNPLGHVTVEEYDARSQVIAETDADGNTTELAYDPLGRLTDVWLADRKRELGFTPSLRFEYQVAKDTPTTVTTHALNADGDYTTSYKILDGFLRQRQTQAPAPGGGRVVTDTFYDSRGNTVTERDPYYNAEVPSSALFIVANADEIPRWTRTVYDGADRATDTIHMSRGVEQWRTSVEHQGDRTLTTAPEGGTGTTSITDARGQVVEVRKHNSEQPTGEYDTTSYTHTARGELETVTDPGGNTWTYTYDLLGRKITEDDPDTGVTTMVYDDLDRVVETTDARGQVLHTTYDALGRTTHLREDSATGPLRASWTYDTLMKGKLATATRHHDGQAYTTRIVGYDDVGRERARYVDIPSSEEELAGSYLFRTMYYPDGSVRSVALPPTGGLPGEAVVYDYDELGNPTTLSAGEDIVTDTLYSKVGDLVQREFYRGVLGSDRTWQTFDFDEKTDRLSMASVVHQAGEGSLSTKTYGYDDTGNLLRINDEPTSAEQSNDVQCFDYDHLRRLTQAWTPNATGELACDTVPDVQNLGGASPYWHAYTYDATGNRVEETQYNLGGNTTRSYSALEQGPAHAVAQVDQDSAGNLSTHTYDYDAAGNMTSRVTAERNQTLEWDAEGELAAVSDGLNSTEYVYDADGERLLRRANGATTLYLPGMEVTWDPSAGTEEATRYYEHAGQTVAVRQDDGSLHWVFSDHHGTGEITVDAVWGEVAQRRMTAFGQARGSEGSWPGERGFVDGTMDASTGLTQLGARAYDAALGRFISVDPLMNLVDAQTMNGYAYANNSPATYWDGTGLSACTLADGICFNYNSGNWTNVYKKKQSGATVTMTWKYSKGGGWRVTAGQSYILGPGNNYNSSRYNPNTGSWSRYRNVNKPIPQPRYENHEISAPERALNEASSLLESTFDHAVYGGSYCAVVCVGAEFQDGVISTSVGGFGVGVGTYGGYAHLDPREAGPLTLAACASYYVGACVGGQTVRERGINHVRGGRVTLEAGFGFQVGADWSAGGLDLTRIPDLWGTVVEGRRPSGDLEGFVIPSFFPGQYGK
ncbi:RHS repeat domain-containing protein [Nocardiopsis sp. EMB25]|uniref:RHS repeat domain-containing protein n=1 Tax=Nocardiopsis sp. EMB25 TaxID=2835867 RepID=UPI002283D5AD|nr:RHS repeat-associated core domain-containing protein [Nocardiopsis sp. EMB25]